MAEFEPQEFVFERPLYSAVRFSKETAIKDIVSAGGVKIDGYCVECGRNSVFHSMATLDLQSLNSVDIDALRGVRQLWFACQRVESHGICVVVNIEVAKFVKSRSSSPKMAVVGSLTKIGQIPTHADIANGDLGRFVKFMTPEDRREFAKANGLAAHGVNIGAFVYLRRVFERLLNRARERAGAEIDQDRYREAKVSDKIKILAEFLPKFMVDNRRVYALLSKGIHQLDEDGCAQLYEVLKQCSLLMLEQEKELIEREELESKLARSIDGIVLDDSDQ